MRYICSMSGGVSSAVATDRVIERFGANKTTVWFADTLVEDLDLYRFVADYLRRWDNPDAANWLLRKRKRRPDGRKLTRKIGNFVYHTEGKTPEWVAEQKHIIPNQKIAPCTFDLKIKPFAAYLERLIGQGSFCVALGYNAEEQHRTRKRERWHKHGKKSRPPQGYQRRQYGIYETYPLLWEPLIWQPFSVVRQHGIEIPVLYKQGFDNNNCGGDAGVAGCIIGQDCTRVIQSCLPTKRHGNAECDLSLIRITQLYVICAAAKFGRNPSPKSGSVLRMEKSLFLSTTPTRKRICLPVCVHTDPG